MGPTAVSKLPERLSTHFKFFFDGTGWSEPDGNYEDLTLRVTISSEPFETYDGYPCYLRLISSQDTETTSDQPPTDSRFHTSQLSTLASRWIKNCQQNHVQCKSEDNHFRPKRLIRILNSNGLQLILPRDLPIEDQIEHVALSHRWGGGNPPTLTERNKSDFERYISTHDLPNTFQEAILACLELEFSYIWIDSLCIIQDSHEDWKEQAAEMHSVYGNCELNLCMTGSENPSESSFGSRDTDLILPVCITLTGFDGTLAKLRLVCDSAFECDIKESPLRQRGWVFQEWYLSKRSLVFGRMQLWWHCREMLACETFPHGLEDTAYEECLGDVGSMKDTDYGEDATFSQGIWWDLIKQYAGTTLTDEAKDRVIAFSGMPSVFAEANKRQGKYVAGMWNCNLPEGLLWFRFGGGKTARSNGYKAPSWSWMSLDGPFNLGNHSETRWVPRETPNITSYQCGHVTVVEVFPADKSKPFGILRDGTITIHGHLVNIQKGEDGILRLYDVSVKDLNLGEIHLIEDDENENSIISYLNPNATSQQGIWGGSARTRMSLKTATGSLFPLPLLHQTFTTSNCSDTDVVGLVLYESLDQPCVFYRIGSFHSRSCGSSFTEFDKHLEAEYPKRSVHIL